MPIAKVSSSSCYASTLYPNKATEPLIFHNRLLISIIYLRLTY
jgi:hypothetical protein